MGSARSVSTVGVFALLVGVLGGCAEPNVSLATGTREYVSTDYPQVLRRWTRSEELLVASELDSLLTVTSTYESWDFRWAYVVRYAHDYRLTIDQRRELLKKTLDETDQVHAFYVALYGANRKATELTLANSTWIVRLVDDIGSESAPLSIERIKKPGPLETTYFPYTTPFRNVYRIRFARVNDTGRPTIDPRAHWFGLRFAGAQGNQELRWRLEAGEARRVSAGVRMAGNDAL